jgi:hypothetical protein
VRTASDDKALIVMLLTAIEAVVFEDSRQIPLCLVCCMRCRSPATRCVQAIADLGIVEEHIAAAQRKE